MMKIQEGNLVTFFSNEGDRKKNLLIFFLPQMNKMKKGIIKTKIYFLIRRIKSKEEENNFDNKELVCFGIELKWSIYSNHEGKKD